MAKSSATGSVLVPKYHGVPVFTACVPWGALSGLHLLHGTRLKNAMTLTASMLVAASVASYARAVTTNDKNCTSLSSVSSMETRMRWANATIPERVMVSKHHGREALGLGRSASCCMRQTHHAVQILENEYRNRFLGTVGNRPIVKPRADLRIAAVIQFFRHPQNIEAIVEPLLHSGLLHELVVNVDDQDECSQLLWRQRLGARPGDMVLLSNNVHELRAYNRGISLTDSELVVLLQDDDIPPLIHDWLVSATTLFAAIPKLAVLSGYAGWIARNSKASGAQTRLEFGDLQTYNGDITWPLPYEVDSVPFMPVTCSYLSPLFLRRSFLDTHYKRFDENLSLPGEPGILLDCDVSYAAWANDWVTGVYPAPFARGIGGHGTWLGENAAARQKRRIKNRRYLTAKYDLANLTRRAVGATKGLSLRRKQGPGSLPGSCWPVLQKRLYADWHIMETWAGATDTRHDECQSPKATIVASESECPAGSIASITGVAACCPARCGRCGGKNCDQLADGPQSCCAAYIQKVGRACNGTNPPCIPGQRGGEKPRFAHAALGPQMNISVSSSLCVFNSTYGRLPPQPLCGGHTLHRAWIAQPCPRMHLLGGTDTHSGRKEPVHCQRPLYAKNHTCSVQTTAYRKGENPDTFPVNKICVGLFMCSRNSSHVDSNPMEVYSDRINHWKHHNDTMRLFIVDSCNQTLGRPYLTNGIPTLSFAGNTSGECRSSCPTTRETVALEFAMRHLPSSCHFVFKITAKYYMPTFEEQLHHMPHDTRIAVQFTARQYYQNSEAVGMTRKLWDEFLVKMKRYRGAQEQRLSVFQRTTRGLCNHTYRMDPMPLENFTRRSDESILSFVRR